MEKKKYVELTNDVMWCLENNMTSKEFDELEYIETGTAEWKLIEENRNNVWACNNCGHIGGRMWSEPPYKYCSGCGFRMKRRI